MSTVFGMGFLTYYTYFVPVTARQSYCASGLPLAPLLGLLLFLCKDLYQSLVQ